MNEKDKAKFLDICEKMNRYPASDFEDLDDFLDRFLIFDGKIPIPMGLYKMYHIIDNLLPELAEKEIEEIGKGDPKVYLLKTLEEIESRIQQHIITLNVNPGEDLEWAISAYAISILRKSLDYINSKIFNLLPEVNAKELDEARVVLPHINEEGLISKLHKVLRAF